MALEKILSKNTAFRRITLWMAGWKASSTMKKEERLNRKIYRLVRAANIPRWIQRFGPKKFKTWILCLGLMVKQIHQLSYRRAMKFVDEYYTIKLHWTTLQKAAK